MSMCIYVYVKTQKCFYVTKLGNLIVVMLLNCSYVTKMYLCKCEMRPNGLLL